jgi:hypothetical protein
LALIFGLILASKFLLPDNTAQAIISLKVIASINSGFKSPELPIIFLKFLI